MSVFLETLCSIDYSTTNSNYTRPFLQIEEKFNVCWAVNWMYDHWTHCYYFIGAYLVAIFAGQKYMSSRPPFQLRIPLLAWNVALATFSIICTWRTLPTVIYSIQKFGFWNQTCSIGDWQQMKAMCIWMFLFAFSKVVELGDTAFIVLRKKPLIMLHWYHHMSVLFFSWSSAAYPSPMQAVFCTINVTVHSIMYSYYALKVLRIRIPKLISMAITSLQLVQMILGMYVTGATYYIKRGKEQCMTDNEAIAIAASIYFSYFVLFSNYFFRTYVTPRRSVSFTTNGQAKKLT